MDIRQRGIEAKSAIDVKPCASRVSGATLSHLADWIERAGIDLAGISDDDCRSRRPGKRVLKCFNIDHAGGEGTYVNESLPRPRTPRALTAL